ncbi:amidohydrolase family protein [Paenibacillus sp. LMG 31461]|uniref:Amidohydrolase family protein n=1 Tax=Paenibacillus plantarum TaxID=2654975 RepID=A0ABX1X4B5_9BACL|nr:amidohydrolase family protein [Paenibacillus plantarum]NOU63255.1 amidohydrolase family protein [Paenibacillus plantarum]
MIIDMHVHLADYRIYPDYWVEGIKSSIAESILLNSGINVSSEFLNKLVARNLNDMDCSRMIQRLDDSGIDQANILLADFGFERDDMEYSIDELYHIHFEALCRYPDRLRVFAGIDPRRGKEGLKLFQKGIEDYGFSGLKLYPPCGFDLDDRQLYPFYEICDALSLPVLTHIGPSLPSMRSEFRYPCAVLDITSQFKQMPFILGHAALVYFEQSKFLPLKRDNIYLEVSGFQTLIQSEPRLPKWVQELMQSCEDRILFGTDWPLFNNSKEAVQYFQQMDGLSESQKDKFFSGNALSIFNQRKIPL